MATVDELHAGDPEELRALGVVVQDVTRIDRLPMSFVGAGLPILEDTLLADMSVTFLQRCARFETGFLDHAAAWAALASRSRLAGTPSWSLAGLVPEHADRCGPDPVGHIASDVADVRAGREHQSQLESVPDPS